MTLPARLLKIVACPSCHGPLRQLPDAGARGGNGHYLRCISCGTRYPIRDGLPILLTQEGMRDARGGAGGPSRPVNGGGTASRGSLLRRARSLIRTQGFGPFMTKAVGMVRTEAERRVPRLRSGPEYLCPCCGLKDRFLSYRGRSIAQCPGCGSRERDRLLMLALTEVVERVRPRSILHVAPETAVRPFLSRAATHYVAMDLARGLVGRPGRLTAVAHATRLPFAPFAFDLVVASHVLEHVSDDHAAIEEMHRVLRPGGVAILPVPIAHGGRTVEYGAPREEETHVRAPGVDYFERYKRHGFAISIKGSSDYPSKYQLQSYRSHFETPPCTGARGSRPGTPGAIGMELWVPICTKGAAVQSSEHLFPV